MVTIEYLFNGHIRHVTFQYPAEVYESEQITPLQKIVTSITGQRYSTTFGNVHILKQKFPLLSKEFVEGPLRHFFETYAARGEKFRYIEEGQPVYEWELQDRDLKPSSNAVDRFDVVLTLRRIEPLSVIEEQTALIPSKDLDNAIKSEIGGVEFYFHFVEGIIEYQAQYEIEG